ncbi:Homocysteine S-methyltransferase [Aspergillus cavernicola]|uniref:Homocysteine S-methyltransferase n=1 Tax=Aspergillus cavernicola TaxID=176166 RepID=A0ABR4I6T7_9EURO
MQILLLDGGLGTTLESPPFNVTFTSSTPLWSSHLLTSSPTTLQAAHDAFYCAGADILLTATYQSSTEGYTQTNASHTLEDAARYMRSAIPLARSVISPSRPCRVALSLGPYGATMTPVAAEYTGIYPAVMDREDALREWHARRLRVFVEDSESWDGVDYVAVETVRRPDEVRAVRGAMSDVLHGQDDKPWWICGVFPAEKVDEEDVRQWVDAAVGEQGGLPRPWGLGLNCTRIDHVARIVSIMQDELHRLLHKADGFVDEWASVSGKPWLVVYPDGTKGEKYDPTTKTWITSGTGSVQRPWDERFWDVIQHQSEGDWEGIIIGGCCRAGPSNIASLRRRIDGSRHR